MGPNAVGDLAGLDNRLPAYAVSAKICRMTLVITRVADLLVEAGSAWAKRPARGRISLRARIAAARAGPGRRRPDKPRSRSGWASHVALSRTAKSAIAASSRSSMKARRIFDRGHRGLARRHRRHLVATATASRASEAARCGMPTLSVPRPVLSAIHRFAAAHGNRYWTPAPLLTDIAARGDTFRRRGTSSIHHGGNL